MKRLPVLIPVVLFSCLLTANGCEQEKASLQLKDLTTAESLYVTRIVVLERAKAVALVDRKTGTAILDSLAASWGDSSLAHTLDQTLVGAPDDPNRSALVHGLLVRILKAERDSLMEAPRPDRLSVPMPDPLPEDDDGPKSR